MNKINYRRQTLNHATETSELREFVKLMMLMSLLRRISITLAHTPRFSMPNIPTINKMLIVKIQSVNNAKHQIGSIELRVFVA